MSKTAIPSCFFVNTQHSPMGAFASFTLGAKGPLGGLGLELGTPAEQNVYVGIESVSGKSDATYELLPFCDLPTPKKKKGVDDFGRKHAQDGRTYRFFSDAKISRKLTPSTDAWKAGDLEFSIHSPVMPFPDPAKAGKQELMLASLPAVTAELTIDNRKGKKSRRFFFGFRRADGPRAIRRFYDNQKTRTMRGIAYGSETGIATDSDGVFPGQAFSVDEILNMSNLPEVEYGLGRVGLLIGSVEPGKRKTFRFAICFHRPGIVTSGVKTSYLYSKFFPDIESVAVYALRNFEKVHARGADFEAKVRAARLSPERLFMLSQAIHSYFGSTQLLEATDGPWWVVNEGEYRMMNTLDLTVDHLPFEMFLNPWTIRNTLDRFLERYSYRDKLRLPGDPREYPGGISFTHDMGVANHFSPPGHSAYEISGTSGTFSWMTHEELLNWTICALVLANRKEEAAWARKRLPILAQCLESLVRRDHPRAAERDGIMDADSSRCDGASEITSYDSLDPALKRSRKNLYIASKTWGTYVGLADYFSRHGKKKEAARALEQADRAAATIASSVREDGTLPALLGGEGSTLILPAAEGIIVPWLLGLRDAWKKTGRWGDLIRVLSRHLQVALDSKQCHFPDGGWKISSTSNNSWLSKIYLNGFLADRVLGVQKTKERQASDRAHAGWSLDEKNAYWAWSDQIIDGTAIGSKYYPRGVTSILWLSK